MTDNWALYATLAGILAAGLLLLGAGKKDFDSRQVTVLAVMSALCATGRAVTGVGLLFLQPTMFLVALTGFVFGARSGFFVGAMTPLISNFFMGQGPWTPWQMLCWGFVGLSGAALGAVCPRAGSRTLTLFCFFWGYLYGALMDIWQWSVFIRPLTLKTYLLTWTAGAGFDSLRALSNLLFCATLGGQTLRILRRFRKRMVVQYIEEFPGGKR